MFKTDKIYLNLGRKNTKRLRNKKAMLKGKVSVDIKITSECIKCN